MLCPGTLPLLDKPILASNRAWQGGEWGGFGHRGIALDPTIAQGQSLPAPPGPKDSDTHLRWGLQVSVDDVVSENVPGAQGAHTTSDVGVAGLATPEPGWHLLSGRHSRHPSCRFRVQYQPGLQVHMRFCVRVQA